MARKRRTLRGTKITGNWFDEHPTGRKGKRCEITGGSRGSSGSIHDVKECAKICGSHWFDKDALRFFKSRVGDRYYHDGRGGAYFTSSEKGPSGVRAYSVRQYDAERCGVDTVGKFQGYPTKARAETAAKKAAMSGGLGRSRRARKAR